MALKQIASFVFLAASGCHGWQTATLTVPTQSVGVIVNSETKVTLGTAFVVRTFGRQARIVTCAHVAQQGKFDYRPQNIERSYPLSHIISLQSQDLSIFQVADGVTLEGTGWEGFGFGEGKRLGTGDTVLYLGYKTDQDSIKGAASKIIATGEGVTVFGGIGDFIEFEGIAKPGFSGGACFQPAR